MKTFFQRSIAGLLLLAAGAAFSQNYPSKPISLMVPYPAGGPSDAAARIFTAPLGKELGQQVIVDNLGGVSGALAAQKVLAAPADGYYLFQGSPNEVILAPLANAAVKLKAEDFRLVHPVTDAVMVVVARKDLPANNIDELIALARKNADKPLTYGSVGIGSLYHLILEDVQKRTGIQLIHAPYKGNAPLLTDIGGGQVDFAVLVYSAGMGAMADQGRLKVIGQLGAQRSELLKNVPTVSEGKELKDFAFQIWSGFMVPKNTPEDVVQRLHKAIGATLKDPGVRAQLAAQTQLAAPPMTLAEAAKFYEAETARYRAIAKSINLQPQ
ncbi:MULTISPECIES: tripartite tricarboxylate transporter substrate binding protein [Variovorax]|jgi:tripartite-type tricarboxylate transporter receptor subunit TctC|uniref:Tripartite tricarboxylate transporter substrate binding protein n=1 Tax=Variovorax ginsengisoli TaxID=363844 RepID=A0ABT8SAG3_9BURK|nr:MULTISPECIES: tripartite tricarboxylate transporter substrate binding protein [Variovorax]MDM0070983.1 tripartite tricarboxylate transporter substrate binding protein [Variovorax sp. J31P207]MDM0085184.1 tripartite tricarboxylate transporter substrate binding protein [Variovorax sp. J31P179]MDN8616620.1 tripartite tricarboxylate transporter substrate binding protein [Variovorax ginsengisoli]MDO1535790.1 tripartite tricarboxylate transporter substrate binding protein [Variovorax ginsengisoli]